MMKYILTGIALILAGICFSCLGLLLAAFSTGIDLLLAGFCALAALLCVVAGLIICFYCAWGNNDKKE